MPFALQVTLVIAGYLTVGAITTGIMVGIMLDEGEDWTDYPLPLMVIGWPAILVVAALVLVFALFAGLITKPVSRMIRRIMR